MPQFATLQAAKASFCLSFPHHFDLIQGTDGGEAVVSAAALGTRSFGSFSSDQLLDAFHLARLGCERVAQFTRLSLIKSFQQAAGSA